MLQRRSSEVFDVQNCSRIFHLEQSRYYLLSVLCSTYLEITLFRLGLGSLVWGSCFMVMAPLGLSPIIVKK